MVSEFEQAVSERGVAMFLTLEQLEELGVGEADEIRYGVQDGQLVVEQA